MNEKEIETLVGSLPNLTLRRQRTAPPTEPGWYFARRSWVPDEEIRPVEVAKWPGTRNGLQVRTFGHHGSALEAWHFFGPVPRVEEAST